MSIATKTAGVVLAATALCGFASLASAATAATPTQSAATAHTAAAPDAGGAAALKGVLYSRGFHVTNLSGNPIKLTSVTGGELLRGPCS